MTTAIQEISFVKRAMEVLTSLVYNELPIQQILLFLEVAEKPNITYTELAEVTALSQSSISKNIRKLSRFMAPKKDNPKELEEDGLDLVVAQRDIRNPRTLSVALTPKGKKILEIIQNPNAKFETAAAKKRRLDREAKKAKQ